MIKLLAIICLCLGLSIVSSQSCTDTTALRTRFGFGNTVASPTAASGVNYCSSIKTSTVCCTPSDINSIQTKTDALLTNLTNAVITRDQYFATANVNPLQRLQTATTNFATTVQTYSTLTLTGANLQAQQEVLSALQDIVAQSQSIVLGYAANVANTNLNTFQAARSTCVVQMVKLQAAVWCLACDPNAVSKGYNSNTGALPLSATTCTRLKAACYPFVSTSSFQTGPIVVNDLINTMNTFSALITRIQNGAQVNPEEFDFTSTSPPTGDVPGTCTTQANCDFICDTIFDDGAINGADLIAGADTSDGSRRLADRRLQSGTYNPAEDEAGVTVTFASDPGNTNSAKSGVLSFGSVLIGAIVLLSSYLL